MPFCCKCNLEIEPRIAVPYVDDYGQPIPNVYRDWCVYHWAHRRGALPPSHPNFLRPLSAATRAKERKMLIQQGYLTPDYQVAPQTTHHGKDGRELIDGHGISNNAAAEMLTKSAPKVAMSPGPPPGISVGSYLDVARTGTIPLFPGFEQLGAWLEKNWQDMEET